MVTGSGEESFVGGDTEAIDLRIGVLDRARADARQSLPKPVERDRVSAH